VVLQRFFIAFFVVSAAAASAAAQTTPAFAPPPVSAVRGVTDLNQATTSPATIAPPPSAVPGPVLDFSVTPTPTAGNAQPLEGGEIVAKIDGEIVLASDVLWQVDMVIEANKGRIPPDQIEDARRALLRQHVIGLIDTKVLYADFKRKVPVENLPKIEENLSAPFEESEIPRLSEALQVKDRQELEQFLRDHGTSLTDAKRQFCERTIAGEWLRQMAPKAKPVTHDELLAYYKAHAAEYDFPAQVKWEELFVQFSRVNGDRTAAWQAITAMGNEVWQQVAQNPDLRGPVFTDVAKAKSHGITAGNGGFRDWTTRGALSSADIDTALFSLEIGQLSDVIESDLGFHIVRVLDRHEAGRTPFTEAQAEITKIIQAEAKKEMIGVELKKLRDKSRIWTVFDGEFRGSEMNSRNRGTARRPE
jgi:hypothetical protein